jgi:hypothetical protein
MPSFHFLKNSYTNAWTQIVHVVLCIHSRSTFWCQMAVHCVCLESNSIVQLECDD